MKNKILIILGIVLLIVVVAGVWFYFGKIENPEINKNQNQEEQTGGNMLVKDGFSIVLPKGWTESAGTAEGITALAFDPSEQITEEAAKKMSQSWNPSYLFIATLEGFYFDEINNIIKNKGKIAPLETPQIKRDLQIRYLKILSDFEK